MVYAKLTVYPLTHSATQDIFPLILGEIDYQIFAEDYGDIPGLDIMFIIRGYFYLDMIGWIIFCWEEYKLEWEILSMLVLGKLL